MLNPTKYRGNNLKIASIEALSIERIFKNTVYRDIMAVLTTISIFDRKGCPESWKQSKTGPRTYRYSLCNAAC